MGNTTRTGRRHFVAQGGAAMLAGLALPGLLGRVAAAQDATPSAATPTSATPGANCAGQEQVAANLELFDRLDFEAWNNRDWDLFRQIHGDHVHVEGAGPPTDGIDDHVAFAQGFIEANPASRIVAHPIRIGAGDWTAVTGLISDGTATTPMVTVARWADGRIAEEYLFFG